DITLPLLTTFPYTTLFRSGFLFLFLFLEPVRVGTEDEQTRGRALIRLARGDQVQVPSGFLDAFEDACQPRAQFTVGFVVGVDLELDDEHPAFLLRGDLGVLDDRTVPHDLRDAHE